ncbi:hypothetical protein GCM10027425_13800 [Alteromonas gracilis]
MSTPSDPRPEGHEPDPGQAPPPPAPQYGTPQYDAPPPYAGQQGAPQYAPQPGQQGQQQGPKRLVRSSGDKMLSGVCGGVAAYAGLDPTLVRLLTVVAVVLTFPIGLIAYIVAAVVMPKA